jgi:hypothetical protein
MRAARRFLARDPSNRAGASVAGRDRAADRRAADGSAGCALLKQGDVITNRST